MLTVENLVILDNCVSPWLWRTPPTVVSATLQVLPDPYLPGTNSLPDVPDNNTITHLRGLYRFPEKPVKQ
jgi:hypothetical protein